MTKIMDYSCYLVSICTSSNFVNFFYYFINNFSIQYLKVNTLGEWIIGIYLHKFTNPNLFIIQIEYTESKNCQTLSQPKPWCNDSGV